MIKMNKKTIAIKKYLWYNIIRKIGKEAKIMIIKCEILIPSFTEIEITETMIKELYNKFRDNNEVLDTIIEYIQEEVGGYFNIQEIENYINEVIKK